MKHLWLVIALAGPLAAQELSLPTNARETSREQVPLDSYALPIAPIVEDVLPALDLEGAVTRTAWRIENSSATTLQVLRPLRGQLDDLGWEVVFECADRECGGFDFRFATEVLPAPAMYVDLDDYRFVAATKPTERRHASLLVSRAGGAAYVQLIQVGPEGQPAEATRTDAPAPRVLPTSDFGVALERDGHVVLSDLIFETGSSDLGAGPFDSLRLLNDYLSGRPDVRIVLVGHSDGTGSLAGNVTLSKRRSASVRARLLSLGAPAAQVTSDGIGFLSPVATNLTERGRDLNRRVEAVVLP